MSNIYRLAFWLLLALPMTSCSVLFEEEPASDQEAIFEHLWNEYRDHYAVFEERGVNWQALYDQYRPLVHAQTTDDELFDIISEMLSHTDDGHVMLIAPGRELFNANTIRNNKIGDDLFDEDIISENYLEDGYVTDEDVTILYGKINQANVGYIWFPHVSDNLPRLHDFLDAYPDANGYIIDLRHNSGGDFTWGFSEMGRLVDQERFAFRSKTKNGKGPNDYTDWFEWHVKPKGEYIDKPLVVLIDRYTISAGERLTMGFDVLPNVTMVGDTTSGAHSTMIGRELANGWFFTLVTQKVQLADGQSYEGIGIAPDVRVINEPDEVAQGIDRALQYAIDLLK